MNQSNALAFPLVDSDDVGLHVGLTKREYFAAIALGAYLSTYDKDHQPSYALAAREAVDYADALIAALKK